MNPRTPQKTQIWRSILIGLFLFGALLSGRAQNLILDREMSTVEGCNQYEVDLTVTGVPDAVPQEVVLLIDRSGSMALDIPGDQLEPMDYAKDAAIYFIENLFSEENNPTGMNRIAVFSYSIYAWANYGFAGADEKDQLIQVVNSLFASGGTNISRALHAGTQLMKGSLEQADIYNDLADVPGDLSGASLDCITSRSFVLLSDGVTNRRFLNNIACTSNPLPPFPENATTCMTDAIEKSEDARLIVSADGEFEQSIYSVGLLGALNGNAQEAAIFTLDQIQNKGLYLTEDAAQLMEIYNDILGQLPVAAYDATLTETIPNGFDLDLQSLDTEQVNYDAQLRQLSWAIGDIGNQSFELSYSLLGTEDDTCGIQSFDSGIVSYTDVFCEESEQSFPGGELCIPCLNLVNIEVNQSTCAPQMTYMAQLDTSGCSPFEIQYQWDFYLNEQLIQTIVSSEPDQLSGIYTYQGEEEFSGVFSAYLSYEGLYQGCVVTGGNAEVSTPISTPPDAPISLGDQQTCITAEENVVLQPLATVPEGMELLWYMEAQEGEPISEPQWSQEGSITFYAETRDPETGCFSVNRTSVTLSIYFCQLELIKTALDIDPDSCNPIQPGNAINYRFDLHNVGNVPLSQVSLTDFLIAADQPLDGPISGDDNSDGMIDTDEVWVYEASYTITQDDLNTGQVLNQAEASAQYMGTFQSVAVADQDQVLVSLCNQPSMELVKSVLNQTKDCFDLKAGDALDYEFILSNTGEVPITDILLIDPLIPDMEQQPLSGDEDEIGVLNPGENWVFRAMYTVLQEDIDEGSVVNTAKAIGSSFNEIVQTNSNTVHSFLCTNPAIAIVKTASYDDGGNCSEVGKPILYTFAVSNPGNLSLSNVVVNDPLLGGDLAGPDSGDTNTDGFLDPDEIWIYRGTYNISQDDIDAGVVINQATATAWAPDQSQVSDLSGSSVDTDDPTETDLCQDASIALIKTVSHLDENKNGCADPGEVLRYHFRVANRGNRNLYDVRVSDPLAQVIGEPIDLQVGEVNETQFYADYLISESDWEQGVVVNQAEVNAVDAEGNLVLDFSDNNSYTEDEPTLFEGFCMESQEDLTASFEVEMRGRWMDDNFNGNSEVGEEVQFDLMIYNTGDLSLYDVRLEFRNPGFSYTGGPIQELPPGEMDDESFKISYLISDTDLENMLVEAQVVLIATDEYGNEIRVLSDDPEDMTNLDQDGDGNPDDPTVVILPRVLSEIDQAGEFDIFNGITPDGDGLNDFMVIQGIENYPQNNFKVFNRWGVLVFEIDGYDNNSRRFEGISEGRTTIQRGSRLPTGTYYYVLTFSADNPGQAAYQGYLYINRN